MSVGVPEIMRKWKGETVWRAVFCGLTPEQMWISSQQQRLEAYKKIIEVFEKLKARKPKDAYISMNEIAKLARSSARTVKEAIKYSLETISLQLWHLNSPRFTLAKKKEILFGKSSLQPKQPTAKERREIQRASEDWQRELDNQKRALEEKGASIKLTAEQAKIYLLRQRQRREKSPITKLWDEARKAIWTRLRWKKRGRAMSGAEKKESTKFEPSNAAAYRKIRQPQVGPERDFAGEQAADDLVRLKLKKSGNDSGLRILSSIEAIKQRCLELAKRSQEYDNSVNNSGESPGGYRSHMGSEQNQDRGGNSRTPRRWQENNLAQGSQDRQSG